MHIKRSEVNSYKGKKIRVVYRGDERVVPSTGGGIAVEQDYQITPPVDLIDYHSDTNEVEIRRDSGATQKLKFRELLRGDTSESF